MARAPERAQHEPERAQQKPVQRRPADDHPRIVDERRIVDPYGNEEREVVDEYGRRFWSFRPMPRQRYDVWGFGWFWWLIFWAIIIGLIVWGWGWGWGY